MNISQAGIDLIKRFEGCRLNAYKDSVGIPTIGYGSTMGVQMGDSITQEEAEALPINDLARFEHFVTQMVKVEIDQNEFDALVSFAFNLGAQSLHGSTLLKKLNDGDKEGAAKEFSKWCHAGGQVLPGLVTRRAAEADLFLA